MCWSKIISISIIIFSLNLFAAEHEAEKPAEGHGAAGAPAAVEKNYSGSQSDEWLKVQGQLTTLKGKVETQKTLVESLIAQKAHGGHSTPEDEATLKKEHAAWIIMIDDYNKLSTNFQNRFPEKGAALGRIYKRIDPENIETLESQMTAEGRMKRLNTKIKKQYKQGGDEAKATTAHANETSKIHVVESTKNKKKVTDEIPVTDQIILQK